MGPFAMTFTTDDNVQVVTFLENSNAYIISEQSFLNIGESFVCRLKQNNPKFKSFSAW